MLKKLLPVLLLIFSTFATYAQLSGIGLRLGGHYSRQYLDINSTSALDDVLQDLSFDGQLGVFGNVQMSEYVDFVPAVNYIRKSYKENYFDFNDTTKNLEINETLQPRWDYISLDLPIRFHKKNDNTLMYMFLGARLDWLINTKEIIRGDSNLYQSYYDDFKTMSVGFIAGLGAEYTINKDLNILFEFTYNKDITRVYSKDNFKVTWELMSFTIGLKFKTIKQGRVPSSSLKPDPPVRDEYDYPEE